MTYIVLTVKPDGNGLFTTDGDRAPAHVILFKRRTIKLGRDTVSGLLYRANEDLPGPVQLESAAVRPPPFYGNRKNGLLKYQVVLEIKQRGVDYLEDWRRRVLPVECQPKPAVDDERDKDALTEFRPRLVVVHSEHESEADAQACLERLQAEFFGPGKSRPGVAFERLYCGF